MPFAIFCFFFDIEDEGACIFQNTMKLFGSL